MNNQQKIWLATEPVDMRKSFKGLLIAAQEKLKKNPEVESGIFVFLGKKRDMVKMLWREKSGWVLTIKKLDVEYRFEKIESAHSSAEMSREQLSKFLAGILKLNKNTMRQFIRDSRKQADDIMNST